MVLIKLEFPKQLFPLAIIKTVWKFILPNTQALAGVALKGVKTVLF
jgi:hypothetical protein